ncbi:MAG TPA: rubrerythrin family protein [Desulfobacteraceae bacterium]|nr:rubrerythrin family protein [Desulfobacteraceae bacterium]
MENLEGKLAELFSSLSRTAERSRLYAMRAVKDGQPRLAKLFLALAESKARQAQRFLVQMRGAVGPTAENVRTAFGTELNADIDRYRDLLGEAERAGSKALATGFSHSIEVDRRTMELHERLGRETEDAAYYVCDFCGYIAVDEPPEHCPVCTAGRNRFKALDPRP